MAMAEVAMATVASSISKAMKVARRVIERPGDPVYVSFVESLAIGPWTAKQTLQRVTLLPCRSKSCQEKRRTHASMVLGPASSSKEDSN